MWSSRLDGLCLSYGAPALPAHLRLLPTPEKTTRYASVLNYAKSDNHCQVIIQCEYSSFQINHS